MKKTVLGTLLFIVDKSKILLIKREKYPYIGYWGMPGGKIDFGEHPEETAEREAREEAGIDTEFVKIRGVLSEIIKEKKETIDHFVVFICELRPLQKEILYSDEGEIRWFDLAEIDKIKLIPSELKIINEIAMNSNHVDIHKSHILKQDEEYFLEMFGK